MDKNKIFKKELGEQVELNPEKPTQGNQSESNKPQSPDNKPQQQGNDNPLIPQESQKGTKFIIKK